MAANRLVNPNILGAVFLVLVIMTACGGGGGGDSTATPAISAASVRPVNLTDVEIAQMLYTDNRRTPSGFYKDTTPTFPGYVATVHLKNTDLGIGSVSQQHEMCNDDWVAALGWSDQASAAMSATLLVDTLETTRYHEFSRVRDGNPQGYLRARVYRCSYLDRSNTDMNAVTGAAGLLNQRPITPNELQLLAEYLWQFTTYNNYGSAVLKSGGGTTSDGLQHWLIIASLTVTGTSGCDRVSVFEWIHSIDVQTGILRRDARLLWDFGARRNAGLIELCTPP